MEKKKEMKTDGKYLEAIGRRKTASAALTSASSARAVVENPAFFTNTSGIRYDEPMRNRPGNKER